jgi:hypothetical protein
VVAHVNSVQRYYAWIARTRGCDHDRSKTIKAP